ncbi:MAG: uroporphyrinogen-III synthase [Planctomycetota bacterium]
MGGPLSGTRLVLTRAAEDCDEWRVEFEALGAEVIAAPCVRFEARRSDSLGEAIARRGDFAAVAFTSARAARFFAEQSDVPVETWNDKLIASVGRRTSAELERLGFDVGLEATDSNALGLARAISSHGLAPRSQVLLPQSERARPVLARELKEAGLRPFVAPIYTTVPSDSSALKSLRTFSDDLSFTVLVFASPSAFDAFREIGGELASRLLTDPELRVLAIGKTTETAIVDAGFSVPLRAESPNAQGIAAVLPRT